MTAYERAATGDRQAFTRDTARICAPPGMQRRHGGGGEVPMSNTKDDVQPPGKVGLVGAMYDLATGKVTFLEN